MPCLDGTALTDDAEGLAFLAAVLETPAGSVPPADAFTPGAVRLPWTIVGAEPSASPSVPHLVSENA